MKMTRMLAAILAFGLLVAHSASAQEKPKPTEEARPITPVKVQVLFTEFEGEKKISSLPYTFFVNADDRMGRPGTNLRMGLRVPVLVATKDSSSVQYVDVGSNLDCSARAMEEGRFRLDLSLERSSLYTASPERKSLDWSPGDPPLSAQPIIRQFRVSLNMLVRDGQTVQATAASDPVSGRVLKIEVTLSVLK